MNVNTNNKTVLKILSGLVALVLWFAITYTEDPIISQNLGDISIVFEGEKRLSDNGLIIVNKDEIPDISAVIRGKRSNVISAMGTVVASCDVSGIETAGENVVEVKYVYPTSTITMAKTKTREITVETQKLVTRNVPVRVVTKNAEKNSGYVIKSNCEPATIRIKGAETDVYTISYASIEIDVSRMESSNTQEYFYKLCDKDGNVVSEENIIYKSHETISVDNTAYKKTTIPVKVKLASDLEESNALAVKNISIDKIDAGIITEPAPTEVYAQIHQITDETEYKLEIDLPDELYIPEEMLKITANCEITPLTKTEAELKIEMLNAQDKALSVKPEKITVQIAHPEGMDITGKVKAMVDLKNAQTGDKLPVKIEMPDKATCREDYTTEVYIK